MPKNAQTTTKLHSSLTSKVMLKFLQARLQKHVNCEIPRFKLDLEKAEDPEIKLLTSIGSSKKRQNSRKMSTSDLLTMTKPLTGSQQTGKFFKRWEYQTTWQASGEICMQLKKQQLELDMGQYTGSKSGKEYIKAVYCHPAYLTYV